MIDKGFIIMFISTLLSRVLIRNGGMIYDY